MDNQNLMYYKPKKSTSKQIAEDSRSVPLEAEEDRHMESIASTLSDKNRELAGKKPQDGGLSEKFFLSDFPED